MNNNYRDRLKYLFWVGVVASTGGALICVAGTTMLLTAPIWMPITALHNRRTQHEYENDLGSDYV